jgi:hypothetical protein
VWQIESHYLHEKLWVNSLPSKILWNSGLGQWMLALEAVEGKCCFFGLPLLANIVLEGNSRPLG